MNYTKLIKQSLQATLAAGALLTFSTLTSVQAQEASTTYKGVGRDPFTKYKRPPAKKVKPVPQPIAAPSIEQRIAAYKTQKARAMNAQLPAPKPTTALLLNEANVTGIFRTPRGYAAMIEAKPIKLSYVIYPGETFYDGMLVAIEEDRLVFRKETRWSDGRREMHVETKALGAANAVKDPLGATAAAATSPVEDASDAGSVTAEQKSETPQQRRDRHFKEKRAASFRGFMDNIKAGEANKPKDKGIWALIRDKEKMEEMRQCTNGGVVNPETGDVTCKE